MDKTKDDPDQLLLAEAGCVIYARQVHKSQLQTPGDFSLRRRNSSFPDDILLDVMDVHGGVQRRGIVTFAELGFAAGVNYSIYLKARHLPMHSFLWNARPEIWLKTSQVLSSLLMDLGFLSPEIRNATALRYFMMLRRTRDSRWGEVFELDYLDEKGQPA